MLCTSIDLKIPTTGPKWNKSDISAIILFQLWEKICYKNINSRFPHDSTEKIGKFVVVSDNTGHTIAFRIRSDE